MDYLNKNISLNLKRIRIAKGYSLDTVAEQTGVSKSMLGQIERGEANPTIGTVGKIMSGLRVEFDELVGVHQEEVFSVPKAQLIPTKELPGEYCVYTYFPFEKNRDFEIYVIEIMPQGKYMSGGHGEHTKEYLIVNEGELTLKIQDELFQVKSGDALRFACDKDHSYENRGLKKVSLVSVFYYPPRGN